MMEFKENKSFGELESGEFFVESGGGASDRIIWMKVIDLVPVKRVGIKNAVVIRSPGHPHDAVGTLVSCIDEHRVIPLPIEIVYNNKAVSI